MFLRKSDSADFELQEYDDTLDSSIRGRLAKVVKDFSIKRSGSDIRGSSLRILQKWIIDPTSVGYSLWTRFVLLWAVYSSFFTPFEFGFFRGLPRALWFTDILVQFVFFADIIITFFVGFKNMETYRLVTDFQSIALRYAKASLVPDFVACLPWDTIYKVTGRREAVRFLVWARLYRVRKVNHFFEELEKDIRINYFFARVAKLLFVEMYCTHIAACTFYYLATTISAEKEEATWIGSLQLGDRSYRDFRHIDLGTRYVTSLYWAVITMATIGFGDIHAVNIREMLFIIVFASVDMILGAYLIGNMTALIVKGSNTEKFRDKMTEFIKYMNRNSINRNLRTQMKNHLRLQFESQFTDDSVIEDLPLTIRAKVAYELYHDTLEQVALFKGCTNEFINQIVSRVREEYFLPGEVIFEQRDAADQLYIVAFGVLNEVVVGVDGEEKTVSRLERHSVFGEVAVLCNVPQPYTIVVSELCKLLRLDKQSFTNLLQIYFPDGRQIVNNLLLGKESDYRLRQRAADIKYLISKQEAELALMLNHAAFQGDMGQLKQLIKAGGDPRRTDYDGRTALHLAACRGYDDIVLFLMRQKADVNAIDRNGITPLLEALKGGHDRSAEALYDHGARLLLQDAGEYLCTIAMKGDVEFLKRLLAYGADPNSSDYDLRTPLHIASSEGLHLIVSILVGAGADIHAKDRWGHTPLDDAKRVHNKIVVSILEMSLNGKEHDTTSPASLAGDQHEVSTKERRDPTPDPIAAAAARKKQVKSLLDRVRSAGDSLQPASSFNQSESLKQRKAQEAQDLSKFNRQSAGEPLSPLEISAFGSGKFSGRFSSSSTRSIVEDFLTGKKAISRSALNETSYVPRKRVTIFPFHPWNPVEKRIAGVVVWTPRTMEELLEVAEEHFGGVRSYVLNAEGGEVGCVDLIVDDDKLYIVASRKPDV